MSISLGRWFPTLGLEQEFTRLSHSTTTLDCTRAGGPELSVGFISAAATVAAAQLTMGAGFTGRHERTHREETMGTKRNTKEFLVILSGRDAAQAEEFIEPGIQRYKAVSLFNLPRKVKEKVGVRKAKRAIQETNHPLRNLNEGYFPRPCFPGILDSFFTQTLWPLPDSDEAQFETPRSYRLEALAQLPVPDSQRRVTCSNADAAALSFAIDTPAAPILKSTIWDSKRRAIKSGLGYMSDGHFLNVEAMFGTTAAVAVNCEEGMGDSLNCISYQDPTSAANSTSFTQSRPSEPDTKIAQASSFIQFCLGGQVAP
ncbi:hypothetical protein B0H16DRAFT_1453244 [Mycena metata]|uniref:Uncharacterized protein n=1 Tax=Mycena metata TaxID=1033252 RepID=A0AAD7JPS1_9AGAR|nr:hypothetical protein B0H16DRAFT_1453241 [Mycena metata]KAJ7767618.1 hypothetical protein B0H16DRAFT_1453244 [Mycena metata]